MLKTETEDENTIQEVLFVLKQAQMNKKMETQDKQYLTTFINQVIESLTTKHNAEKGDNEAKPVSNKESWHVPFKQMGHWLRSIKTGFKNPIQLMYQQYGKPNGKGTMTYANGDKYEGEFKHGEPNGKGKMTYANGNTYEGEFQNGTRHGRGTLTYDKGGKYEGEFQNGSRLKGKMTYANGGNL